MRQILRISLLVSLTVVTVRAIYPPSDLEQVPVDRLVANLEILAKERPTDVWVQVNIGRAHGMAYARKVESIQAMRVRGARLEDQSPFVELNAYVPFRVVEPTSDPAKQAAAAAHLEAAIVHFRKALEIDPSQGIPRLSLGWCLEQLGDKAGAIVVYRDLVERAGGKPTTPAAWDHPYIAAEAIGYLIPLLDPSKDAAEIASIRQRREKTLSMPRPVTPVAVPLRNGLRLTDVIDDDAAVRFDADGTGLRKSWTWITQDAAWLVYDQRGRGEIRSALQFFGSVSFWMFWETGYDAMRALDDNRDGRLTGRELTFLGLWRDGNSNGVSEWGEVRSLDAYDVVALSYQHICMPDVDRTAYAPRGVIFRNGTVRPTWDVVLQPAK